MRFVGRYEHSLDVKGRIILPVRFRAAFDTVAFVSKHNERCLAVWTPDAFEEKLDEMQARQDRSPQDRQMVRAWASGSAEVELDRHGRGADTACGVVAHADELDADSPRLVTVSRRP